MATEFSRILVPVSGHTLDENTVSLACRLARDSGSSIAVLYVIPIPRALPLDAEIATETARGEQVLQRMEELGKKHKRRLEGHIIQARDVGPAVVLEAVERRVDLIVMGLWEHHRYGAPTLGDTVPHILKYAPCQVLVNRGALPNGTDGAGQAHD